MDDSSGTGISKQQLVQETMRCGKREMVVCKMPCHAMQFDDMRNGTVSHTHTHTPEMASIVGMCETSSGVRSPKAGIVTSPNPSMMTKMTFSGHIGNPEPWE